MTGLGIIVSERWELGLGAAPVALGLEQASYRNSSDIELIPWDPFKMPK